MTDFELRLQTLQLIADALPAAIIVHQIDGMQMIYMNKTGIEGMGTTLDDLRQLDINQYHHKHFNAKDSDDYVPKVMELINTNSRERVAFFQEVRQKGRKEWRLHASNTMVFARNGAGQPTHIVTIAALLDDEHHLNAKVARLVEENAFYRENSALFFSLTRRELEVVKYMALDKTAAEIGQQLNISEFTAETHRRNIRRKLNVNNQYDIIKFAQAFHIV